MRSLLLLATILFSGPIAPAVEPDSLFAHDPAAPLNVQENFRVTRGATHVRDVTFSAGKQTVTASIVAPVKGAASHPGILWVHWFGDPQTTNRTQFLDEAIELAASGVVSVLVDAMWSKPGWWEERRAETDLAAGVRQVIELRRALDLLLAQPGVDSKRIGFVGHDFGAMFGAVMGAVDRRPTCYVLLAPTPRLSDWYLFNVKPADPAAYQAQLAPLDPIGAVGRLAPAAVLYQFTTQDKYVPAPRPDEFLAATMPRKYVVTYETGHKLAVHQAAADRIEWLSRELGLP